jgi:hypothetical protein
MGWIRILLLFICGMRDRTELATENLALRTLPADATDEFVLLLFKGEEEARSVWGAGYEKPML